MQFNSYIFFVFFAGVLAVHYAPALSWRAKKASLLVASYLFYAAWNPPFVVLIWLSTLVDWFIARALASERWQARRRTLVVASLALNLGLLGFFKYAGFLAESFTAAMAAIGVEVELAAPDIVLPVGISFYTFQTLSYTLDVFYHRARPWHSFLDYALYVTFFPQLVAGPIVRSVEFLPQCERVAHATAAQLGWGMSLVVLGVFQKNVVADGLLAPAAEAVFAANVTAVSTADAWVGTLAFAGQILCDFAGYSTCAIGAALCLGFELPANFRFPYAAIGFSDFWRRWHISLSTWLRDYLYIPLGGNRRGPARTHVNLMITMLLGGLWHGASWTFVAWGGLHGVCLVGERAARRAVGDWAMWRARPVRLALILGTFALVCVTWVLFRAGTFDQAFMLVGAMFGFARDQLAAPLRPEDTTIVLWTIGAIVAVHAAMRRTSLDDVAARVPWWTRAVVLALLLAAIAAMPGEDRAFIYFQF